jgi:hypothetical protein
MFPTRRRAKDWVNTRPTGLLSHFRLGETLTGPTTTARKDKIDASESGNNSLDTAMLTVDDNSCHRTGLRRAELRQRGWFMVG